MNTTLPIAPTSRRTKFRPSPTSNSGGQRCGVQSPASAADLARLIASAPNLRFGGLMTYPSDPRFDDFVRATRDLLAGDDLRVERVSGGGTPRVWQAHQTRELTE